MRRWVLLGVFLALALAGSARATTTTTVTTTTTTTTTTLPPASVASVILPVGGQLWIPFTVTLHGAYTTGGIDIGVGTSLNLTSNFSFCEIITHDGGGYGYAIVDTTTPAHPHLKILIPGISTCTGAGEPNACCTAEDAGTCDGLAELPDGTDTEHSGTFRCVAVGTR